MVNHIDSTAREMYSYSQAMSDANAWRPLGEAAVEVEPLLIRKD